MPKKNDFKLDVVSVRLVKDAPIYSEHTFNNPADIAAVMGDCMCQFDREVVCVVNLRSDLKPINVHFASVGSLNEAMAHPRELFKSSILMDMYYAEQIVLGAEDMKGVDFAPISEGQLPSSLKENGGKAR